MTEDLGMGADLSAFVSRKAGADGDQIELLVRGAHCASCLTKIEKAALKVPGVTSARFNLTTGKLATIVGSGQVDPTTLMRAISEAGFEAAPYRVSEAADLQDQVGRDLLLALAVAGFGAANVMMFTVPVWAGFFGQEMTPATRETLLWLSALVAAPCTVCAGMPFFKSAWRSLRRGKANMDVPISIAVGLTLIVSFAETARGGSHAYFDAAVSLLFLLLIGRYLDHRMRATARSAARDLLALQASIAVRLTPDGKRKGVPVDQVSPGDRLVVAPGERIPVDGQVEAGRSELDNSLISGESLPILVSAGIRVFAGALNQSGELTIRATAPSEDSAVAAIARLMEAGAQSRSAYVQLADKAAALYVPVVHIAALVTFLAGWGLGLSPWEAILRAAAVLIVTCPCALGLAVPAVQVAASGRLFRKGILVKSGAALERLAEVDTIIFDKTGVLTEGRPVLLTNTPQLVELAAPLARASRHPLARALADAAGAGPVADCTVETPGQGIEGMIDGRRARLGRADFLGIVTHPRETELWFGFDGETRYRLAFHDEVRPEAAHVLAELRAQGYELTILSGDTPDAVEAVANAVGVDQWSAGLTPMQKVRAVEVAALSGRKVLMVGDGLNDAAALAQARASMAPGAAIDASQNAADIVYSTGSLSAIPLTLKIAQAARRRALENFGFAGLYNLVAIPTAMAGLINPFFAALAMSGSSLVVTLNALRMAWIGREP